MSKRMIRVQRVARAVFGGVAMTVLFLALLLFIFLLISTGEERAIISFLALDILSSSYCWYKRDMFFGRMEIKQEGIVYRCFGRRTMFVPWGEIENVKTGGHRGGIDVIRKESDTFRRSKASIEDGYDFHIEWNEENDELLKEYMPQHLKDMLGPYAFL